MHLACLVSSIVASLVVGARECVYGPAACVYSGEQVEGFYLLDWAGTPVVVAEVRGNAVLHCKS